MSSRSSGHTWRKCNAFIYPAGVDRARDGIFWEYSNVIDNDAYEKMRTCICCHVMSDESPMHIIFFVYSDD